MKNLVLLVIAISIALAAYRFGLSEKHPSAEPQMTSGQSNAAPPAVQAAELDTPPLAFKGISMAQQEAAQQLDAGRFAEAVSTLRSAISNASDPRLTDVLRHDLAIALQRLAIHLSEEGSYAAALRAIDEALVLLPEDQNLQTVKANALYRQALESSSKTSRRSLLEQAISIFPAHHAAHTALAQICEEEDNLECALSSYANVLSSQPENTQLKKKIELLKKQQTVENDFKDIQTQNFKIRFEGYAEERTAWKVLTALEKVAYRVNERLGASPDERITVVLYTGAQYGSALGAPDWSGGLFDGKIRVRHGDMLRDELRSDVLAHEYTHAAVALLLKVRLPGWLGEGIAMHMESRHSDEVHRSILKGTGASLTFSDLVSPLSLISDGARASLAYSTSYLMVSELLDRGGWTQMRDFLNRDINGSTDIALKQVFQVTPDQAYRIVVDGS